MSSIEAPENVPSSQKEWRDLLIAFSAVVMLGAPLFMIYKHERAALHAKIMEHGAEISASIDNGAPNRTPDAYPMDINNDRVFSYVRTSGYVFESSGSVPLGCIFHADGSVSMAIILPGAKGSQRLHETASLNGEDRLLCSPFRTQVMRQKFDVLYGAGMPTDAHDDLLASSR